MSEVTDMDPFFQTTDRVPKHDELSSFDRTPLFNPAAGNGSNILPNVPLWGQLTEWTPSPNETPEARMNCGPMACSIVIKAITGVTVPSVYIHDLIHGPDVVEGTTLEQIQWLLSEVMEIQTTLVNVQSVDDLLNVTTKQIAQGRPYIELMYFSAADTADLHFRVGFGHDPYECMMVDPWYASIVKYGHNRHYEMSYKGLALPQRHIKGWKH